MPNEPSQEELVKLAKEKQISGSYNTENKGWYIAVLRGLDSSIETAINAEISYRKDLGMEISGIFEKDLRREFQEDLWSVVKKEIVRKSVKIQDGRDIEEGEIRFARQYYVVPIGLYPELDNIYLPQYDFIAGPFESAEIADKVANYVFHERYFKPIIDK